MPPLLQYDDLRPNKSPDMGRSFYGFRRGTLLVLPKNSEIKLRPMRLKCRLL